MNKTKIEWADRVWNPVTGCTKVSAGCKNCYAEALADRFWGERKFTDVRCHPEKLYDPLRVLKPQRVFVNSMSDLFHPDVPDSFIAQMFAVMAIAKWHTFMILTKRPERMNKVLESSIAKGWCPQDFDWPLPNVWLGVSAENQATADERIPLLLQTPSAVRFVSVEPMLENVDLTDYLVTYPSTAFLSGKITWDMPEWTRDSCYAINWVICGSESGPHARPFEMDWAHSLKDQCVAAHVPFFLKQATIDGKLVKMPELDGRIWDQIPEAQNGR